MVSKALLETPALKEFKVIPELLVIQVLKETLAKDCLMEGFWARK
jgi:hypothetical protein